MGRATSQCLIAGPLTSPKGMWHRLLLLSSPWEVAVTLRQVLAVPRVFGSGSSRVCALPGEWEQQWVVLSCSAFLCADLLGGQGCRDVCHRPLVLACHAYLWSLRWPWWFVITHIPHKTLSPWKRWPAAQEPEIAQRKIFLSLTLPSNDTLLLLCPRPPPQLPWLWCSAPQPMVHHSLSPQGVPTQPILVFLELTSGTWVLEPRPPKCLKAWCPRVVVPMVWAALFLLCPPQSGCCALFQGFDIPLSWLISHSVEWIPRVWVLFLFHSSLLGVLVPSWSYFFLSLFFPFILPSL